VLQQLLEIHGAPLVATTLIPPDDPEPMNEPEAIRARFEKLLDAVIGAGACPDQPTTVVDLTPMGTGGDPVLMRLGRGDPAPLGL
jgi:tRNA A37 threonylcarbamoyladenosine synthetase subunit TsaC/SUA5/YrdC